MATDYPIGVFRATASATNPTGGPEVPGILMFPLGVTDITIQATGSAAASCKIEKTFSAGANIALNTAVWVQVDASLDAVGTTPVVFDMGAHTCVAFRVSSIVLDETASLVLVGRKFFP